MNYKGSKLKLLDFLEEKIISVTGYKYDEQRVFCDLFAGTGVVGRRFREMGHYVISNDNQHYSGVINRHYIMGEEPIDRNLINYMNNLPGIEGFVYNNYCLGSGSERMYFSDENGKKIDAIRKEITRLWDVYMKSVARSGFTSFDLTAMESRDPNITGINESEYYFLLASLISSATYFSNTTGDFSAFLKKLQAKALKPFELRPLDIISGPVGEVHVANAEVLIEKENISGDVLYLDPPYNHRQYCANYHLLETIALNDNPEIRGKTGLRSDDGKQRSIYSSKVKAEAALEHLLRNAKFQYVFLSYNNEGIVSPESIEKIMTGLGDYQCFTFEHKRFKSVTTEDDASKPTKTTEYLHCLEKK